MRYGSSVPFTRIIYSSAGISNSYILLSLVISLSGISLYRKSFVSISFIYIYSYYTSYWACDSTIPPEVSPLLIGSDRDRIIVLSP